MSRSDEAISATDADAAFAPLMRFKQLILAVSGGPDSLALLHLVAEWRQRQGLAAPLFSVATVDHGLRPESAGEARFVAEQCAAPGVPHTILHWDGAKPSTGVPNAARAARYALLEAHAREICCDGAVAVVTAHHQDDQAETVLMRLARGGGVDALAAMPSQRPLLSGSAVLLVRPLLCFSKAQLIATLSARNVAWLDDPTNRDATFERTRVRAAVAMSGISAAALTKTAQRMSEARDGLNYAAGLFMQTLELSLHGGVYASLDRNAFDAGPAILRQRVLSRLIGYFGGRSPKPEMSELEALVTRLDGSRATAATLGGAVISLGPRSMRVWREPGRLNIPQVVLTRGQGQLWDNRFWVALTGTGADQIAVNVLGRAGYETIAAHVPREMLPPSRAAYSLPAFFADAGLLCVPQLGVHTDLSRQTPAIRMTSEPNLTAIGRF